MPEPTTKIWARISTPSRLPPQAFAEAGPCGANSEVRTLRCRTLTRETKDAPRRPSVISSARIPLTAWFDIQVDVLRIVSRTSWPAIPNVVGAKLGLLHDVGLFAEAFCQTPFNTSGSHLLRSALQRS